MAVELRGRTGRDVDGTSREPLVIATAIFAVALVVHAADHFRRGMDVLAWPVFWGGNLQLALAVITIVLVVRRHRLAPQFAVVMGFVSAVGFVLAHLLPHWSSFSDSFTGAHVAPHVTGFSWFAALFEIAADLALGVVGTMILLRRRDDARA
jgi:hypothetical protein